MNKELTSLQVQIVIEAQAEIIANPQRAVVNPESSFVRTIIKQKDTGLSVAYWWWSCCPNAEAFKAIFNDPTIRANQETLKAVDRTVTMPSWGYTGT